MHAGGDCKIYIFFRIWLFKASLLVFKRKVLLCMQHLSEYPLIGWPKHNRRLNMSLKGELYMDTTRFLDAAENGDTEAVRSMIADGADVNATDEHDRSAAYKAAKHGHLNVLKLLSEHDAALGTTDNRGTNALYWAAIKGHEDVARFLVEKGVSAHITDDRGWTLLDHVGSTENPAMKRLIEEALAAESDTTT